MSRARLASTDGFDDHSDCEQCTGYSAVEIETFECPTCDASFSSPEDAERCCTDPHFCCMTGCSSECTAYELEGGEA